MTHGLPLLEGGCICPSGHEKWKTVAMATSYPSLRRKEEESHKLCLSPNEKWRTMVVKILIPFPNEGGEAIMVSSNLFLGSEGVWPWSPHISLPEG